MRSSDGALRGAIAEMTAGASARVWACFGGLLQSGTACLVRDERSGDAAAGAQLGLR
jgi:hypothetical protein